MSALSTSSNGPVKEWLPPSMALQRFAPPGDLLWNDAAPVVERKRYGYRLASLNLLVRAEVGSEVIRAQALAPLPGAATYLLGLINLRGNLVPVFDLGLVLGGRRSDITPNKLFLILDKGDNAVGMVIDSYPQPLVGLRSIAQLPQLPATLEAHVPAAYMLDERVWLDFNHESFFDKLSRSK
ncbi:chemotaxis protein CheW [Undibacterium sp. CY18W]|uniref:Chemotaxis protein CheW n=1 Tax=Undibacterium hunanense TaxID=2762292 RepID=A0ABR6ZWF3_9BURK|nr:chemotaxis protein CheW [Undibacterium hunanense]MBC3920193.1 chemotaxis protein CheW [Undibacterium hunanense]